MAVTMPAKKENRGSLRSLSIHPTIFVLVIFSILYFTDVCFRASEKFFWYDELFTLYFSRLPDLHSLWKALNSGIDFNPPLFYLLTKISNALFGEGNIATRLPEILGFWIFSLCVFQTVKRRAGVSAGFAAMLLPMLTGAYFYAYDARPHALVLGACGLAILCWQMAAETFALRRRWLIGLSVSLFFAFMFHCFALALLAPFALAEFFQMLRSRRVRWGMWLALLVPALVSLPLYIPLLSSYRQLNANNAFSKFFVAGWREVPHFYLFLFGPCVLILFGMLILFALDAFRRTRNTDAQPSFTAPPELILALAFIMLPVFGVALAKLVNGPFFSRYFLSSVAGACMVVGICAGARPGRKWISHSLVVLLIGGVALNALGLLKQRIRGEGEWLQEPSTHYLLNTTPGQPLAMHPLLTAERIELPIAVVSSFDFIYLNHYDPGLKHQLHFVAASQSEFVFAGFRRLLECAPGTFNAPLTISEFARRHADFLVYGDSAQPEQVALLGQFGLPVKSLAVVKNHFLARLSP
jgi:hypothetical protein